MLPKGPGLRCQPGNGRFQPLRRSFLFIDPRDTDFILGAHRHHDALARVLIDADDVIVHLFRPEVRTFYNLERMWAFGDESPKAASAPNA